MTKKEEEKKELPHKIRALPWGKTEWGWDPILGLETIRNTMNEMFADIFARTEELRSVLPWHPEVDIYEEDSLLVIKVSLPGVRRKDIQIHATHDLLILSGELEPEKEFRKESVYMRERKSVHFERSIPLPYNVEPEQIKASLKDGVLAITLPFYEKSKRKSFKVKID